MIKIVVIAGLVILILAGITRSFENAFELIFGIVGLIFCAVALSSGWEKIK